MFVLSETLLLYAKFYLSPSRRICKIQMLLILTQKLCVCLWSPCFYRDPSPSRGPDHVSIIYGVLTCWESGPALAEGGVWRRVDARASKGRKDQTLDILLMRDGTVRSISIAKGMYRVSVKGSEGSLQVVRAPELCQTVPTGCLASPLALLHVFLTSQTFCS